jgi:hypothetical protein
MSRAVPISIQRLEAAGLLQAVDGSRAAVENVLSRRDVSLGVTPALTSLQNVLRISLRDLLSRGLDSDKRAM